jgi:uncharacterized protein (TIGR02271 family)
MSQAVIGVFDDYSSAQQAARDLMSAGIDRDDIRISHRESTAGAAAEEDKGFWESLKDAFGFGDDDDAYGYREAARRGGTVVSVDADEKEVDTVVSVLQRHRAVNLDERASQWGKEGWSGYQRYQAVSTGAQMQNQRTQQTSPATGQARTAGKSTDSIPVVEEQLRVGKEMINRGGIRIHSRVTERPVEKQVNLREEHVGVERHRVDRPLTEADKAAAFQNRTIEARETAERAVVGKEARVVEEVSLNKDVNTRTENVRDTVRRTDVEVERLEGDERFRPAAEFADELTRNASYRGRQWTEVEPEVRRSFEQRHPGSKWDEVKDTIRSRYNKASAH